jgi:hypothetical protein
MPDFLPFYSPGGGPLQIALDPSELKVVLSRGASKLPFPWVVRPRASPRPGKGSWLHKDLDFRWGWVGMIWLNIYNNSTCTK